MAQAILVAKLLFLVSLAYSISNVANATVSLQNPSFESPPTNLRTNASSEFTLLNSLSTIPGWSFQGTVWYVTSGSSVSLPGNGHGLQLGPNGMISQTFIPDGSDDYVLTFTLAPSSPSCANDATAISVSGPSLSKVFFYRQALVKERWQTYAYAFWRNSIPLGGITLQIQSVASSSLSNSACWPIIDDLLLTGIKYPLVYGGNGFLNSGFEVGPGFLESSSQGILLEAESNINPLDIVVSALQNWIVLGTVKYIDSRHYAVPQGQRAVELVGNPSGISYNAVFYLKGQFTLDFIMGDAGDSCVGDLAVVVQVGTQKWNFAMRSNGLGSSQKYTVKFNAAYSSRDVVPISFSSYNQTRTSNNKVLCGPVIDGMFVRISSGLRSTRLHYGLVIFVIAVTYSFFA